MKKLLLLAVMVLVAGVTVAKEKEVKPVEVMKHKGKSGDMSPVFKVPQTKWVVEYVIEGKPYATGHISLCDEKGTVLVEKFGQVPIRETTGIISSSPYQSDSNEKKFRLKYIGDNKQKFEVKVLYIPEPKKKK